MEGESRTPSSQEKSYPLQQCRVSALYLSQIPQVAPDSPILGLVEDSSVAGTQRAGTSAEAEKSTPVSSSGGGTGESPSTGVPLRPFQSLPGFIQEKLGAELFDDPLLTLENMKDLQDKMKWSYNFMRVSSVSCRVLS